jgi:hypothetical protein
MGGEIDVIVAVHDIARPIGRAVRSVLGSHSVQRVIVVCHDLDADAVRTRLGALADDERVLLTEHRDGIRSPAGPFNHGLELADARYVAVMGSDDTVTEGAFDSWHEVALSTGADMVIAPLRHAGGARVATPPTRRRRGLRGEHDRLAFRTAPLGLVSRERFGRLRFTSGLATGEDLAYSTRIWFSGAGIAAAAPPAYYEIHDDGVRVTFSRRPLREDLLAVSQLIAEPDILALSSGQRRALAVKLWRVNLFGGVHYRAGAWGEGDRAAAAVLAADLTRFSPESIGVLSRAEGALREALLTASVTDDEVDERSRRRRRFLSFSALVPVRSGLVLSRDAPLRFSAATWWAGRG